MRKTSTFVVTIVNDAEDLKGRVRAIHSGEQTSFDSRGSLLDILDRLLAVERASPGRAPASGVRQPGGAARGKA